MGCWRKRKHDKLRWQCSVFLIFSWAFLCLETKKKKEQTQLTVVQCAFEFGKPATSRRYKSVSESVLASFLPTWVQVSMCVCSTREGLYQSTPLHFNPTPKHSDNHPPWPFTKINITCDPWPLLGHLNEGPPAGWWCLGGLVGGGHMQGCVCHANQLA